MNKIFVAIVLGCAVAAVGQQPAQPAAPAQSAAPAQQKKEIKDPAEYNAYVGAVQQQDPAARISGLEAFLTQYPNSVMKEDALEILMGTYQQTGNVAKMGDAAQRLLQVNPNNVRALALLAYTKRTLAQSGQNPQQNLADAKQYGQKGLDALKTFTKPDNMSDADYQKLKTEMGGIFSGAVGIGALQDKDFKTASADLRTAAEVSPNDFSIVYPLALAYLSQQPRLRPGLERLDGTDGHHADATGRLYRLAVCASHSRRAGGRSGKDQEGRGDELRRVAVGALRGQARGRRKGVERAQGEAAADAGARDPGGFVQQPQAGR